MNYKETIEYLFSRLPMYQRVGAAAYKANLDNTIYLDKLLNRLHQHYPTIHIAGTNGKGSVSHLIASVLQEAGYKTGLYTSPHLLDFRERIKINGIPVSEEFVIQFTERLRDTIEMIEPSFFEITVAMAFQYFAENKVDVAIIETGLGGRLDSTNIITPELSVITNVTLEHTALLGNTIEKIANEKAGIIKAEVPVVIGRKAYETDHVFLQKAWQNNAEIFFASDDYQCKYKGLHERFSVFDVFRNGELSYPDLLCDLAGSYQSENIATALKAISILQKTFTKIDSTNIIPGIKHVSKNTSLHGRWEIVQEKPMLVLDIAHNPDAIKNMLKQLENQNFDKLNIVLGMSNDKNHKAVLSLFPHSATYYFCKPDVPRGLDAAELSLIAHTINLKGTNCNSVSIAINEAVKNTTENDLILVTGSAFVVAEAMEIL